MQFVVHAIDNPEMLRQRLDVLDAHRRFLDTAPADHGVRVLLSGPLVADDGSTMRGSFFLLEARSRTEIEALFEKDPLWAAGVWNGVQVSAVQIRQNSIG
ncbi:YciI family protein [Roseibium sp. LAB1]